MFLDDNLVLATLLCVHLLVCPGALHPEGGLEVALWTFSSRSMKMPAQAGTVTPVMSLPHDRVMLSRPEALADGCADWPKCLFPMPAFLPAATTMCSHERTCCAARPSVTHRETRVDTWQVPDGVLKAVSRLVSSKGSGGRLLRTRGPKIGEVLTAQEVEPLLYFVLMHEYRCSSASFSVRKNSVSENSEMLLRAISFSASGIS